MVDAARALSRGRQAFAGLLTDTCRITGPGTGAPTFNETTGAYDPPARVTVYEGPCRMQVKVDINSNVVETTAGEHEWTYLTSQLQLPAGNDPRILTGQSADVQVDHVLDYLTSASDASLPGRKFNIAGPYHKSHAVYRRFRVREGV